MARCVHARHMFAFAIAIAAYACAVVLARLHMGRNTLEWDGSGLQDVIDFMSMDITLNQ